MRSSIRGLTEGALITAVYLILLLLTLYTPLLGTITGLILSVPFIVAGSRHSTKVVVLTALAATFVAGLITGVGGLMMTVLFASVGSVMGLSYQKYKGSWTALSLGFLTTLIGYVLMLLLVSRFFDFSITEFIKDYMNQSINLAETITGGTENEQLELIKSSVDLLIMLLPALIIMAAIINTMINHIVGIRVLKRLGTSIPPLPPFKDWKLPRVLLFYYLISLILALIPAISDITWIQTIVINSIYLLGSLFIIQGLSFIAFFSWSKGWGKAPLVFAIVGIFLLAGFGFHQFISLLGMIDLGFDMRGRIKRK